VTSIDDGDEGPTVELDVVTTNQDGTTVFQGSASGRLDP
jgi:hypothetical protein